MTAAGAPYGRGGRFRLPTTFAVTGPAPEQHANVAAALATLASGNVAVVALAEMAGTDRLAAIERMVDGIETRALVHLPRAASPRQASLLDDVPVLEFADAEREVGDIDAVHDLTIMLGCGGLTVPFGGEERWTLGDIAVSLPAAAVVVTTATAYDHAALTVARLEDESVDLVGLVIADWPDHPTTDDVDGLYELGTTLVRTSIGVLSGTVPTTRSAVRRWARSGLPASLGGTFELARFAAQLPS